MDSSSIGDTIMINNYMKERNVTVTLNKAKEWFNSGNATLREIALQAFSKEELIDLILQKLKHLKMLLLLLDIKKVLKHI